MRFIGNKELITADIVALLKEKKLVNRGLTLFDAFCGTGAVSDSLKGAFNVVANDLLAWCVLYTRGRIHANEVRFDGLGFDPFLHLNENPTRKQGFFYAHYSPGGSRRMYFTPDNAARIDYFRNEIELWNSAGCLTKNEYQYLLACLIESVSAVSNTAGVYGAYLKHWDGRALKPIEFLHLASDISPVKGAQFHNSKVEDIIGDIDCDILYIDPPYTQNQYGTQYHLLETLILQDAPTISAITGSRSTGPMRSDWSKQYKAHILLDKIIATTKAKYVLLSYSQDGLMSKSFIEAVLKRYGKADSFECRKISYRKYTNFKSRENYAHFEYLFFVELKSKHEVTYESPLNYIGSKAKLASTIKGMVPSNCHRFVDAFAGGFNVGINIDAQEIVYNDINHYVRDLIQTFKDEDTYQLILSVKRFVKKFGLEPEDSQSYSRARAFYNSCAATKRDPKLLFAIILYGFNQQIRFNSNHEFNNPVGMRWFNDKVLEKVISFSRVIKQKNVVFESKDYYSLLGKIDDETVTYLDPPYRLTRGSYNDGKRGFEGWDIYMERRMFEFVNALDAEKKPFIISYVLQHKGRINSQMHAWIKRREYRVIRVDAVGKRREEVLILNPVAHVSPPLYNKQQVPEAV